MADLLKDYFGKPGQDNPYGGLQPNSAIPNPTYLGNNNPNFWVNNKNWEGSLISEVWGNIQLPMIRETEFYHLRYTSGEPITAPRNAGTARISYKRLRPLSVNLKPLKEGELPPKVVGGSEKASATYTRFAVYMQYTDVEYEQNPDEILLKYTDELMRAFQQSLDQITREFMYMGASYAYANGCASVDEVAAKGVYFKTAQAGEDIWKFKKQRGAQLTFNDIRECQKLMKLLLVKPHPSYGKYVVLLGVEGVDQLRNDYQFKDWNEWTDPDMFNNLSTILTADILPDIMLVEIPRAAKIVKSSEGKEVGVAFILGEECYKEVTLTGATPQFYSKPLGSAGTGDPVNQTGTIGIKHPGWGLAIVRSEALIALHYALGSDAVTVKGTTLTWTEAGVTINHEAEYTFTSLRDGLNFYADLNSIYDGAVIYPKSLPTDQDTYVKNQSTTDSPKPDALTTYWDPAMQDALGKLIDVLPALKQILADAKVPLNVENLINATFSKEDVVDLKTVLTVTALGEIGSGGNVQPTTNEIKAAVVAKNTTIDPNYIQVDSATKTGANIIGNSLYKGTVPVTFTTKADDLTRAIPTPALGSFSGAGTTPTSTELEAAVKAKNATYSNGDATFSSITTSTATATASTGGKYKGTVSLTYTYTQNTPSLSTIITNPNLGGINWTGDNPTESDLTEALTTRYPKLADATLSYSNITTTSATVTDTGGQYAGSVALTYTKA